MSTKINYLKFCLLYKQEKPKLFKFSRMWSINAHTNLDNLDENDLYAMWEWQSEDNCCPACEEWNGWQMTLDEWLDAAIPGHSNGEEIAGEACEFETDPFGTFCEEHCKCQLRKVSSAIDIRKP